MIPKIYDQLVSNWPSHTWLKQTCDEERENDEIVAIEFRHWPQVVSRAALVADQKGPSPDSETALAEIVRRPSAFDPDEIGCAACPQVG